MKNTISLIIMLLFTCFAFGQGNLQFNQVLLLNSTANSNLTLGTVPAGKVWKIESFGGFSGGAVYGTLNGNTAGTLCRNTVNNSFEQASWTLPVWLPAGTQLGFTNNNGSFFWYSIIEFNVVP